MTNDTPAYSGPPRLAAPHLVGIDTAGSGLPGLAQLLLERGARVSGSTLNDSDTTAELAKHGVRITHDHGPHLVRADMSCLVWSGRTTPTQRTELERAEQMRVPTHHYPEALAQLFHATNTTVAVAGSHSTASVAGMLTSALGHLNPAWVLRTPLVRHGVGHHSGGDLLIADLGEDGDLEEHATVSVVTAIAGAQPQHLGYETLEELEGLARRSETVVLPTWDRGTAELAARLAEAPARASSPSGRSPTRRSACCAPVGTAGPPACCCSTSTAMNTCWPCPCAADTTPWRPRSRSQSGGSWVAVLLTWPKESRSSPAWNAR